RHADAGRDPARGGRRHLFRRRLRPRSEPRMIKLIVAALWISIATTGALLIAFQTSRQPEETAQEGEATPFKGLDYVKTGIISVPVFDKGKVHGYFLARLVFVAEGKRLAALK